MSIEMNQVLAQMRAMSIAASDGVKPQEVAGPGKADFSQLIQASIDHVNEAQTTAKSLATAFESGDTSVELTEVMVALQKSNVSFQAITQVRNKLLNAYQEVMNMQV